MTRIQRLAVAGGLLELTTPAFAHVGVPGHVYGFSAGFAHPLGGLDHIAGAACALLGAALVTGVL